MKFQMWSVGHILYILSPIVLFIPFYFLMRKRSDKTLRITDIVLAVINISILILRNVDIFISNGWDPEILPLQVCHLGNIFGCLALLFRNKTMGGILMIFNLPTAFIAMFLASALTGYDTIWSIRPMCYLIGHFVIVFTALYTMFLRRITINFKSFLWSLLVIFILLIPAVILNSYFNNAFDGKFTINYFYLYDATGTPFGFYYDLMEPWRVGWFVFNPLYTFSLIGLALGVLFGLYGIYHLIFIRKRKEKPSDDSNPQTEPSS